jgi:hypothetical protein
MGSEAFTRLGLGRSKEGALDYPDKYTVIGVDIDAAALIKRYVGTKGAQYAADVIGAVVQKHRTAGPPPPRFVRSLIGGVNEPVILCDLGADAKGKSWAVVVDGRQRVLGLRLVNESNDAAKPKLPRLKLAGVFRAFAHSGAGLAASLVKCVSNVHVSRTHSQRADDAVDLDGRGVGYDDIATAVDARDVAEVAILLSLAGCAPEVQAAVDAGQVALADVAELAKHDHAEQARRVARKTAGPSRAAKTDAAPARNYRLRPAQVAALVTNLGQARHTYDDAEALEIVERGERLFTASQVARLVRRVAGEQAAIDGDADLQALLGADDAKGGGK